MQHGEIVSPHFNPFAQLGVGPSLAKRLIPDGKLDTDALTKVLSIMSRRSSADDNSPSARNLHRSHAEANALIGAKDSSSIITYLKQISDPQSAKNLFRNLQTQLYSLNQLYLQKSRSLSTKLLQTLAKVRWSDSIKLVTMLNPFSHSYNISYDLASQKYRHIESNENREKYGFESMGSDGYALSRPVDFALLGFNGSDCTWEDLGHQQPCSSKTPEVARCSSKAIAIQSPLKHEYWSQAQLARENALKRTIGTNDEDETLSFATIDRTQHRAKFDLKDTTELEEKKREKREDREDRQYDKNASMMLKLSRAKKAVPVPMKILGLISTGPVKAKLLNLNNQTPPITDFDDWEVGSYSYYYSPFQQEIQLQSGQAILIDLDLTDLDPSMYTEEISPLRSGLYDPSLEPIVNTANSNSGHSICAELIDSDGNKRIVAMGQIL